MSIGVKPKEIINKSNGFELLDGTTHEEWERVCDQISNIPIQYKFGFIEYNLDSTCNLLI